MENYISSISVICQKINYYINSSKEPSKSTQTYNSKKNMLISPPKYVSIIAPYLFSIYVKDLYQLQEEINIDPDYILAYKDDFCYSLRIKRTN